MMDSQTRKLWLNNLLMVSVVFLLNHLILAVGFTIAGADKIYLTQEIEQNTKTQFDNKVGELKNNITDLIDELNKNTFNSSIMLKRVAKLELDLTALNKIYEGETDIYIYKLDNIERSKTAVTNAFIQLTEYMLKRIKELEELTAIQQLEQELINKNYDFALLNLNIIQDDTKIAQVIKNVYRKTNDFDELLYFGTFSSNITKKIVMFVALYDNITIKDYNVCNLLKLIDKVKNNILNNLNNSSEQYKLMTGFIDDLKQQMLALIELVNIKEYGLDISVKMSEFPFYTIYRNENQPWYNILYWLEEVHDKEILKCNHAIGQLISTSPNSPPIA